MPDGEIVYVDMDDVICDFAAARAKALVADPGNRFPQSVPGFFENLEPVAGAIDGVEELRSRFDVFVLTAPSTRNAHCYTEKRLWIERHFGYVFTKRLIISPDKGLLRGDYLVDDHASGKGQDRFDGELVQFGTADFPNWNSVVEYLMTTSLLAQR